MRVVFLTLGTRGDVQPYIVLGQALKERGHEVAICTGATFRGMIESRGIPFYEAAADLMAIIQTPMGQKLFNGGGNPLKTMTYLKEVLMPLYRQSMVDFLNATEGADLIVYHPKALGATDIAEFRDIPAVAMPPVPILVPIEEFPNLAVAPKGDFGPLLNRLTYKVTEWGQASFMKDINGFRTSQLHLPARKNKDHRMGSQSGHYPVVYPISPSLFSEVTSWHNRVSLTGFFFHDTENKALPHTVSDFVQGGDRPIVITFSSMPLKKPQDFVRLLYTALEKTGERIIVLTGSSGMVFDAAHPNLLVVEQLSHGLIFKAAKAIIHHGGAGTTAEALRSGIPQWIMPFNVDQPFWAERLYKMGLSLEPIKVEKLTLEVFLKGLTSLSDSQLVQRAKVQKVKIDAEEGVNKAVALLEGYLTAWNGR